MSFIRKIKKGDAVYLAEVQSIRKNGKVVQKFIKYVGKEIDGKTVLSGSISQVTFDSVKVYGPLLILDTLAQSIKLHDILGEYAKEILSIVYAHCINPQSVTSLSEWFSKTDLNTILSLDNVTEDRLLRAIDSLEKLEWDYLQQSIYSSVKMQYPIDESGIFYDVTNTYLYGKHCPLGKRGHSKEGKADKPIVQIGLGILRESGIPIFHRVYEGNVHDARIFSDVIERFSAFGLKDIAVIFDRGMTSENNVKSLKNQGLESISGIPIRGKMKITVKKISQKKNIHSFSHRIALASTKMYAVDIPYTIGGVRGKLLLCYNPHMKNCIQENRRDEIMHARACLQSKKRIKPGLKKYFDTDNNIMQSVVSRAEEMDGYSCIFSSDKSLSNEKIVRTYFEKDLVEKTFHILKGILNIRPIRHWLHTRVVGHIFICYLSYLLFSLLQYRLRISKLSFSANAAIKKMETFYKIYAHDSIKGFQISKTVALTKEQEQIIHAVEKKMKAV